MTAMTLRRLPGGSNAKNFGSGHAAAVASFSVAVIRAGAASERPYG
jgi:hypothetical protein